MPLATGGGIGHFIRRSSFLQILCRLAYADDEVGKFVVRFPAGRLYLNIRSRLIKKGHLPERSILIHITSTKHCLLLPLAQTTLIHGRERMRARRFHLQVMTLMSHQIRYSN